MVALPKQYMTNDPEIQTGSGIVCIPEGQYKAIITSSDFKATNSGGNMLVLNFSIVEGQYQGTELVDRLNIVNANPVAEKIAYGTLGKISSAIGLVQTPADSTALHNKPMFITVKNVKQDDWTNDKGEIIEGKEKSEIKGYSALPAVGTQQAQPVAQQPVQQQAQPTISTAPLQAPWG